MKNIAITILLSVISISVLALPREPYVLHNTVHDENFDPLSKVDYHVKYSKMDLVEYDIDGIRGSNTVRLIVFPDCFYVGKFKKDKESIKAYCGANIENIKNDRYKNSGLDENGYWDMRTFDDNPDNEVSYWFNFNLEKDGDVTFNLSRSLNAVPFIFSCMQKFNPKEKGVDPNPIPVCTLEAMGRKGRKLKKLFDQFSPKEY